MKTTLSNSVNNLKRVKANLNRIRVDPRKAAVETHESLVLVNAPATIGRLAVILNRIDYMTESGLDYGKIMVISPTMADVENIRAAHRFTGNMTAEQFITKISNSHPVHYKDIIINGITDTFEDNLADILQFVSENNQSVFAIGDTNESALMKDLIDSGIFTVYNL